MVVIQKCRTGRVAVQYWQEPESLSNIGKYMLDEISTLCDNSHVLTLSVHLGMVYVFPTNDNHAVDVRVGDTVVSCIADFCAVCATVV